MIKILFATKRTYWHKDICNCKRNEAMNKKKIIFQVKFYENLNLTYVYSHEI